MPSAQEAPFQDLTNTNAKLIVDSRAVGGQVLFSKQPPVTYLRRTQSRLWPSMDEIDEEDEASTQEENIMDEEACTNHEAAPISVELLSELTSSLDALRDLLDSISRTVSFLMKRS
jgi:hypothetical protein